MLMCQTAWSQRSYDAVMHERLEQIRAATYYSVDVTLGDPWRSFPDWDSLMPYYQYDIVYADGRYYECLSDSVIGQYPPRSPTHWLDCPWNFHPYQFLSDSAKTSDLLQLLKSDNPMIKVYSFSALVHRNEPGMFEVLLENLSDTTRILAMWGDVGEYNQVATLLIYRIKPTLTRDQSMALKDIIRRRYSYIETEW